MTQPTHNARPSPRANRPMAERIEAHDWASTSLGPPDQWPQELRTAVDAMLDSDAPMFVGWGPEQLLLYNDGYAELLGDRHPAALGRPLPEVWSDSADTFDQQARLSSTEEALRETEDRYQTLFNSVDEGICIFEMIFDEHDNPVDYRWLEINPTFEEQTGLVDAVGKTAREMVPDLDESWFEIYGDVALTGEPVRFENHAPAMGRWFDVYAVRVGQPEDRRVALFFRNITEQKKTEKKLRDSEQRFRTMADTAPAMLWITDQDNVTTYLSRGWYEYTGQSEEEGLGRGWAEAVHPDDREEAVRKFLDAAQRREPFSLDFRLRGIDGQYRWAIDRGRPRFADDGAWLGYIGSVIDVHERKTSEQALREADRRKDRFMALLSHELRNPLAPIKLSLRLLDLAEPGSSEALRAREVIERQTDQLSRLVDDLLDTTRVNSSKIQLQRDPVELNELLMHTVDDHRSLFESKDIALELDECGDSVWVNADPNRLGQVVGNLLQNAAKFTPSGEHARVSLTRDAEQRRAEIRVSDTGVGMTEEMLDELFEPFTQADTSLDHASGGLGLGLSLVRGLVELHGGEVRVESEGLGRGSEFTVWLPLIEAEQTHTPAQPSTADQAPSRRVVVIEDNPDLADALSVMLETRGHQVEIARNGAEGIEVARRVEPDVLLCDIGLPGLDGYDVARRLREDPQFRSTYMVALSGYATPEDVNRAREAGFDRHIAKPAQLATIVEALAAAPDRPSSLGR